MAGDQTGVTVPVIGTITLISFLGFHHLYNYSIPQQK